MLTFNDNLPEVFRNTLSMTEWLLFKSSAFVVRTCSSLWLHMPQAVLTHQQFQWGLKYTPGIVHHFGSIWSGTYQYQGISGYSVNQNALAPISADPSAVIVKAKTYPSNNSTLWLHMSYTPGQNLWPFFSTYNKYTRFARFLLYWTSASNTYLFWCFEKLI